MAKKQNDDKTNDWLLERCGRITSSQLKNLMTSGRGGKPEFGETAIKYLYEIKRERQLNIPIRNNDAIRNFIFGHENEPRAIEWLKANSMYDIKSCSTDFDEIIINKPFEGFGDSPDFYVYNSDGTKKAIGEIKCLISESKFEMIFESGKEDVVNEYKEQFAGHFLGDPEVDELWYLVYDGIDENDLFDFRSPLDERRGKLFIYKRSEFEGLINDLEKRIKKAISYIDRCIELGLKVKDINSYYNEQ